METYLGGQPVTAEIALTDDTGANIVASAASYRLLNQADQELTPKTVLATFNAGDEFAIVTVSGTLNTITAPATRELRIIELTLTTDEGTILRTYEYLIEASELLVEGVNSFQSYSTALLGAYDIPNITAWNDATKQERVAAMIQARLNMAPLRFRYVFDFDQSVVEQSFGLLDITLLDATAYANLPTGFKEALRRAQIMEADYLLGGDVIGNMRRSGVVSQKVGESSQFFGMTKPLEMMICKRAMVALSKYIDMKVRVGRTGGPSSSDGGFGW